MNVSIFKFGGASIKDAEAIRQMTDIVQHQLQSRPEKLVLVVSAMGKTTNKLEKMLSYWYESDSQKSMKVYEDCMQDHRKILNGLPPQDYPQFDAFAHQLKSYLNTKPTGSFDFHYDQIVSYGELFSSSIIHQFLQYLSIDADWADSRKLIKTSDEYRAASVNWTESISTISSKLGKDSRTVITQGFLGGHGVNTTTLGREGSDYSAAILACALYADEVTFWKDVPGVMNMDPKISNEARLYQHLPYKEAAEMTYYGAQIIHPKTIKPLENSGIKLLVKPFKTPTEPGTTIGDLAIEPAIPSFIFKDGLCLMSFQLPDFEFVNETHLRAIFSVLSALNINIYMMQNSAISISVVIDQDLVKIENVVKRLGSGFSIRYNTDLSMRTIKNYTSEALKQNKIAGEIFMEQTSRFNQRILFRKPTHQEDFP